MKNQTLKQKLDAGGSIFGTVLFYTTHPSVADVLPDRGLDFVMVHVEHNVLDLADYVALRYALRSKGIACLARTHSHDPDDISRICDTFPDGVVVPYVEDIEHLRLMVAAAKCRPLKGAARRLVVQDRQWPSKESRQYVERLCECTLFIAMIESPAAVENLEAICAIGGIDALLVGPNDLTVSMGIPEQRDHPRFVEAVQRVIDAAESRGIAAGAHFACIEHAKRTIKQGARLIVHSSDQRLIQHGIPEFLAELGADALSSEEAHI